MQKCRLGKGRTPRWGVSTPGPCTSPRPERPQREQSLDRMLSLGREAQTPSRRPIRTPPAAASGWRSLAVRKPPNVARKGLRSSAHRLPRPVVTKRPKPGGPERQKLPLCPVFIFLPYSASCRLIPYLPLNAFLTSSQSPPTHLPQVFEVFGPLSRSPCTRSPPLHFVLHGIVSMTYS